MDEFNNDNVFIEQMLKFLSENEASGDEIKSDYVESARSIEKFFDEIPGGFFIYRADGDERLLYANRAVIRIFGCEDIRDLRKLVGNSFRGMVHPDDLEEVEESIKQQIKTSHEDLDYVEYRIIRKDGSVRWIEDYGHFIRSKAAGDVFYVFVSDSTEKITRQQQEKLQHFKLIDGLSINYDSILYADLDKNTVTPYRLSKRLQIYFEEKLQVREFDWLAKDYVKTWVHPEDRALVSKMTAPEHIKKELADSQTFYINYRCIEGGATKYLQLRIVNVGSADTDSQIVLGYRTIDKEIRYEMQQRTLLEEALRNAELASVAKNTFLSNMSHDMRTPLNAIFGYTALARKNLKEGDASLIYLDKIEQSSRQIFDSINKVLEMSYLESQDFRINEGECDLLEEIQNLFKIKLELAERKNIKLTVNTDGITHGGVVADKDKLIQVLRHLIGNAINYTPKGGHVDIAVTEQKALNGYSTYRFCISDTGIGISAEAIERIFEPFVREKNTTDVNIFGSGLGLTIAKYLIEAMGGSIEVKSEVGKGSVFTVTLDLRISDFKSEESSEAEITAGFKGKKILVVEDNEINLEIETEILEDLGLTVDVAQNGKIAVDKIAAAKPDEFFLIIMDIQMPVMDGREAAENIRRLKNKKLASIPIIALSANAFESDRRASLEAGMNAHLTKPIDVPLLIKTIGEVLSARK